MKNKKLMEAQAALATKAQMMVADESRKPVELMQAVAAEIIQPLIEADVKSELITDYLLERQPTAIGEVKWPVKPTHVAYVLDEDGDFVASPNHKGFVSPLGYLMTCQPVVNMLDLRRGYIAPLTDQEDEAKNEIVRLENSTACNLLIAAADPTMTVSVATTFGLATWKTCIGRLQGKMRKPKLIVCSGTRSADFNSWNLPVGTVSDDLIRLGAWELVLNGAVILPTVDMPDDHLLIISDLLPGRIMDEFPLSVGEIESQANLKYLINLWMTCKMAVTNRLRYVLVNIT